MALHIGGRPAAARRARPGDLDLRAVHRDRQRHHQRQPALGQQHPDHQRRDARDRRHRDRLPGRRQRVGQRHRRLARAGDAPSWRAPTAPPPLADAAEDRAELVDRRRRARTGPTPPGDTSIQVFETFASAAGRGVQPGRRREADPLRLRLPRGHHDLPRLLDRAAAAPRAADRALRLHRQERRADQQRLGRRRHPRLRATSTRTRMAADLATRLGWGERRVDLPAGPLRHGPAADRGRGHDDLRLLERRRPQRARRPDGLLQARRRHPDRRARSSTRASGCTPTRRTPDWSARPFVIAGGSSDRSSVYDNGLPLGPTDWIARRAARPR